MRRRAPASPRTARTPSLLLSALALTVGLPTAAAGSGVRVVVPVTGLAATDDTFVVGRGAALLAVLVNDAGAGESARVELLDRRGRVVPRVQLAGIGTVRPQGPRLRLDTASSSRATSRVTYRVTTADGASDTAVATVRAVRYGVLAQDDQVTSTGTAVTVDVLANDRVAAGASVVCGPQLSARRPAAGRSATVVLPEPQVAAVRCDTPVPVLTADGLWSVDAGGRVSFRPSPAWRGRTAVVHYRVASSHPAGESTAQVLVSRAARGSGSAGSSAGAGVSPPGPSTGTPGPSAPAAGGPPRAGNAEPQALSPLGERADGTRTGPARVIVLVALLALAGGATAVVRRTGRVGVLSRSAR